MTYDVLVSPISRKEWKFSKSDKFIDLKNIFLKNIYIY